MMNTCLQQAYVLLEVLVALFLVSFLVSLGFRYHLQIVKQSEQQFQQLFELNQARNQIEQDYVA